MRRGGWRRREGARTSCRRAPRRRGRAGAARGRAGGRGRATAAAASPPAGRALEASRRGSRAQYGRRSFVTWYGDLDARNCPTATAHVQHVRVHPPTRCRHAAPGPARCRIRIPTGTSGARRARPPTQYVSPACPWKAVTSSGQYLTRLWWLCVEGGPGIARKCRWLPWVRGLGDHASSKVQTGHQKSVGMTAEADAAR